MKHHRKKCDGTHKKRHKFKRKCFTKKSTIFDELELRLKTKIPFSERIFPWFVTYDIESYFSAVDDSTANTEIYNRHEILSVAVSSNINESDVCFVNDVKTLNLVELFVMHLSKLVDEAFGLCCIRYQRIIQLLDSEIANSNEPDLFGHDHPKCNPSTFAHNSLGNLKQRFLDHIKIIPVVGFNSGKYDTNVFKQELLQCLLDRDVTGFIIKDGNNFKCLQTRRFRFLDICQYIAPGFSYRTYLESYNCSDSKSYFPNEHIDSLNRLEEKVFPSKEKSSSKLGKAVISDQDYHNCKHIFESNSMSLREYLIYYNLLDTKPFIEALEKQRRVYWEKDIDMLKDFVSAPDMARQWLFSDFNHESDSIMLIDKHNSDMYYS